MVGSTPFVLVVNPAKVPAKNAKELQAFLKAKPGDYNYASSGNGTIIHLAGEMFVDAAGVDVKHIPYKGVGPQVADIIGGQVEMGVVAVPAVQAHIKSGALRAIGVMGKQRVASLPDVPTIAEQGFPDVDVAGWFAVVGPAKLPAAQVKRLHDAVVTAFNDRRGQGRDGQAGERDHPDHAGSVGGVLQERAGALRPAREEGRHQARLRRSTTNHTGAAAMTPYRIGDKAPRVASNAYVAREATVIGEVNLGDEAASGPVRCCAATTSRSRSARQTNVQEGAVLHADPGFPLTIGERVTIGHQAMLHGCTVGDGTLIGIQAVVMNGAVIGKRLPGRRRRDRHRAQDLPRPHR